MDIKRFVGHWLRFIFTDGETIEAFLIFEDSQYFLAPIPGEQAIVILADEVAAVEPAQRRPPFLQRKNASGKRIVREEDLDEFLGRPIIIHWKGGTSAATIIERSILADNRLAIRSGATHSTFDWQEIESVEISE